MFNIRNEENKKNVKNMYLTLFFEKIITNFAIQFSKRNNYISNGEEKDNQSKEKEFYFI